MWDTVPEQFRKTIEAEHVVLVEREERGVGGDTATLRSLLIHTRDGEWGSANPGAGLVPIRVIRGTDFERVRRGDLTTVPIRYLRAEKSARKALKPGDILIETAGGSKGRPTGRTLLIQSRTLEGTEVPFTCASFARFLRVDEAQVNAPYLYWFLQHLYQIGEMERHQVQHTGIARFQFTRFSEEIQVPLPPLPEQRHIAHILGMLDDKIELNRRMNQTLEEMARALFKSWFVDFDPVHAKATLKHHAATLPQGGSDWSVQRARAYLDRMDPDIAALFPDSFVDSALGPIPEGWEVKKLGESFNLTMGQSPPGSTYNEQGEGLPFFQGRSDFGFRFPENRKFCTAPARIAQPGDCLVSVRAPVGDINMAWGKCCIGPGVAALRHKSGTISFSYYSAWTIQPALREYEQTGTVFGAINKSQFETLQVIAPSPSIVDAFDSSARPLDEKIRSNIAESRTLAAFRDALLPKLVSGDVRVKDGERFFRGMVQGLKAKLDSTELGGG